MSDKYKTEYKGGNFMGITPIEEYVIDRQTGEYVGELVRWEHQDAGDKIKDGDWTPYPKEGDE